MQSSTTELFTQHNNSAYHTSWQVDTYRSPYCAAGDWKRTSISVITADLLQTHRIRRRQLTAGGGGLGTKWLNGVSVWGLLFHFIGRIN